MSKVRIHYFGHSAFALETEDKQAVIIDPFITGNPHMQGKSLPKGLVFSHILLTHGHGDHSGDAESLAKLHGATVVAPFELANLLAAKGVKSFPCALGGKLEFPWGWMRLVPATHSSSFEGKYAGAIVISDTIKDGAKEAIRGMKAVGVKKCVMLTGDRKEAAELVAKELDIDEVHAELLPQDKVSQVEALLSKETEKERQPQRLE